MTSRRRVRVSIDGELLAAMVRSDGENHYRLGGEIPGDAKFIGVTHDPYSNLINLFFEHASFPECEEGQAPAVRPVSLTRLD